MSERGTRPSLERVQTHPQTCSRWRMRLKYCRSARRLQQVRCLCILGIQVEAEIRPNPAQEQPTSLVKSNQTEPNEAQMKPNPSQTKPNQAKSKPKPKPKASPSQPSPDKAPSQEASQEAQAQPEAPSQPGSPGEHSHSAEPWHEAGGYRSLEPGYPKPTGA